MSESLPAGWKFEPLGRLAQVVSGGTPSRYVPEFWEGGSIPWVTPTDITGSSGRFLSESHEHITELGLQSCSAKKLPSGTLLMTSRATLGEARIALGEVCTNQGFKSLIPFKGVDGRFLYYQIALNKERYKGLGIGSTFLEVNKRDTERFELLVAPEEEQRRIAEILSTVDEAIEQTEALIEKYQQIKTGLMHDLFTRGVTPNSHLRPTRTEAPHLYKDSPLGWIPKEWEFTTVGNCISGIDTGKSPDCPDIPASGDQWGVLKVGAIDSEGFREKENKVVMDERLKNSSFIVRQNDLLLSRANTVELVGLVCHLTVNPGNLMLSDKTLRLRPITSRTTTRFLFYSLQTSLIRRQIETLATGTSGSMKNISQTGVESLRLVRPQLAEQTAITDRIDAMVNSITALKAEVGKFSQQKHGLMHDLLTGRVRVQVEEAETPV